MIGRCALNHFVILSIDIPQCVEYVLHMTNTFGNYIRSIREQLKKSNSRFSLRRMAERLDIEPAYLSKIERDIFAPPSEKVIVQMAYELDENPDTLLALAGKISSDLVMIIRERPEIMAAMIRAASTLSDEDIKALFKREIST